MGLGMATQQKIPRDLITSREALDTFEGLGYSRLRNWWDRGVIRSWRLKGRRVISRAELRRELEKRDGLRPYTRKGYMGELDAEAIAAPSRAASAAPRAGRKSAGAHRAPVAPPLPELPDLPPGLSWDYTGS